MTKFTQELRDFVFRAMLFESEADHFRRAGIHVGLDRDRDEEQLLLEALSAFGVARRASALEMARLYAVLHAFENELRSFIRDRLEEEVGSNWFSTNTIPKKILTKIENRRGEWKRNSWLEGVMGGDLEFADFGDLASIIIENWEYFRDIIPSQDWVRQRMFELEKARNFIAHNRILLPAEFQRMYMYVSDWNKVVGL